MWNDNFLLKKTLYNNYKVLSVVRIYPVNSCAIW